MATIVDVINASKGFFDSVNITILRNFLVLNDGDYLDETDYDDMVPILNKINNDYIASYATSMYGKQPSQLTDSEIFDIRETMTITELENSWNNYFHMWDDFDVMVTIDFAATGWWTLYYSITDSGYYNDICWVEYNTPLDGNTTRIPHPIQNNNGCQLTANYLIAYDYKGQSLGWYNNSALSGTPLQIGDIVSPVNSKVQLYTGIFTPSKVIQMNNKITENNDEVKYKIYPITKAIAVLLDNGMTLQEWNSENWIKRESDAPGVGNFISWNSNAQGVDSGKNASSFASNTHTHSEYAPLASPNFTGIPNVPLATSGNNSNQIASTNFVQNELLNHYGVSTTAAGTTAKVVTTIGGHFKKSNGNSVKIRFTYRNTVNNITLNVDSTGASNVVMGENNSNVADMWVSNSIVEFIFDGTNYCMVDRFIANTTNYGLTKLVDSVSNTSNLYAATPNAVNAAYTRASSAYTQANSAYTQANNAYANANLPKIGNVTLNTTWTTNGTQYEKTVSITGLTANSQVDLTCNTTVINHLLLVKSKALYFENRNGTLYAVSVGNKPTQNLTVQYTMYTVS